MPKDKSTPTMADVAREAGVALGTVSRVVNGQQVGEEFREKVEEAIRRLGYQYNSSGRALHTGNTNTIAFIIPNTINPYFALLVHHVNMELEKRGCRMLLCFTEYDTQREMEFIQMARQNLVDGVIALTYNPTLTISVAAGWLPISSGNLAAPTWPSCGSPPTSPMSPASGRMVLSAPV